MVVLAFAWVLVGFQPSAHPSATQRTCRAGDAFEYQAEFADGKNRQAATVTLRFTPDRSLGVVALRRTLTTTASNGTSVAKAELLRIEKNGVLTPIAEIYGGKTFRVLSTNRRPAKLWVGERWQGRTSYSGGSTLDEQVQVLGIEEMKVPAGTFEVWKVGSNLTMRHGSTVVGKAKQIEWRAPTLGIYVRQHAEVERGKTVTTSDTALASYHLGR